MTSFPYHRLARLAFATCALLLAAACVPAGPSTGPSPDAQALARGGWTAQSPAAEVATWTRQGCRRAPGGRDACIERTLVALIDQAGISKSMEVLDTLAVMDRGVQANAHALAHGLGIAAYRSPETLAATINGCPVSQMSGCYHGVVQGYFLELSRQGRSIGTAEMDGLCNPHRESRFVYFQCAHGMGHGLMAVHQNHLPMSLEGCDRASDEFVRTSCYGGVFMENIVNVTHPHHTAGGHAGTQGGGHGGHGQQGASTDHAAHGQQAAADEHAGHGQHAAAHAGHGAASGQPAMVHGPWRALDRNDWLYPCNAVALKYQRECYNMQTSAIMFFNYGNVKSTARVCGRAPAAFQPTCFYSLGRDVTAFAAQNPRRSARMCEDARVAAAGRGRTWCLVGVVQALVNQSADPQDGIRFCRLVGGAEAKGECYRVVGETIAGLVRDTEARGQACQSAEREFVAVCRRGAGVEPTGAGSD
ncbi:MAG TPA: hypothetical protein VK358_10045 [Longimicrobium sp.]|nr:hypothetical protein [Longimicrobium sp.]